MILISKKLCKTACSLPIIVRQFPRFPIPHHFLFMSRHFGTGVLIATAFVHLLPTAFVSLTDPCLPHFWSKGYPAMAGLIAMLSMLVVVGVEMFFASRGAGHVHAHGHGDGTGAYEGLVNGEGIRGQVNHNYQYHDRFDGDGSSPYMNGKHVNSMAGKHFRSRSGNLQRFWSGTPLAERRDMMGAEDGYVDDDRVGPRLSRERLLDVGDSPLNGNVAAKDEYHRSNHDRSRSRSESSRRDNSKDHNDAAAAAAAAADDRSDLDLELDELDPVSSYHQPISPANRSSAVWTRNTFNSNDKTTTTTTTTSSPQKLLLQCLLLEAGILFHSIFIGMALSVSVGPAFLILLLAISFHQVFEGFALGTRIAALPFPPGSPKPWLMALAYGTTTPLGQAIGLAIHNLYDPASQVGLLTVGSMNAVSSGLLVFAGLVELLAEDFLSEESYEALKGWKRVEAYGCVVAGAALMALVGAWA